MNFVEADYLYIDKYLEIYFQQFVSRARHIAISSMNLGLAKENMDIADQIFAGCYNPCLNSVLIKCSQNHQVLNRKDNIHCCLCKQNRVDAFGEMANFNLYLI